MDERELLSSKFASEVESLQATQRREFRDWVSVRNLHYLIWHCVKAAMRGEDCITLQFLVTRLPPTGDDGARRVQDEQPAAGPGAKV